MNDEFKSISNMAKNKMNSLPLEKEYATGNSINKGKVRSLTDLIGEEGSKEREEYVNNVLRQAEEDSKLSEEELRLKYGVYLANDWG